MKKILLILTIVTSAITMSCTREHICECVSTDSDGNPTSNKTTITGTRKKAIEKCDAGDSDPAIGYKTDCEVSSI
jgi:hypothetical protein